MTAKIEKVKRLIFRKNRRWTTKDRALQKDDGPGYQPMICLSCRYNK